MLTSCAALLSLFCPGLRGCLRHACSAFACASHVFVACSPEAVLLPLVATQRIKQMWGYNGPSTAEPTMPQYWKAISYGNAVWRPEVSWWRLKVAMCRMWLPGRQLY